MAPPPAMANAARPATAAPVIAPAAARTGEPSPASSAGSAATAAVEQIEELSSR